MTGLKEKGPELLAKGYQIVPTIQGQKRPVDKGWPSKEYTLSWCTRAIENGYEKCGVGIKGEETPAIDIDVSDEAVQNLILDYVWEKWGVDLIRWGRRPLLMFRCEAPMSKRVSNKYANQAGEMQMLELLGVGQQFIAYGLHPDGFEYTVNDDLPAHADLPLLTADMVDELFDYFHSIIPTAWVKSGGAAGGGEVGGEPKLAIYLAKWQVEDYMERSHLNPDDYNDWIKMGLALHHQFTGGAEGLELWDTWSFKGTKYKVGKCAEKWEGFSPEGRLTFRSVIHSCAVEEVESKDARDECLTLLTNVENADEIFDTILIEYRGKLDDIDRERVAQAAKTRYRELSGTTLSIDIFRGRLQQERAGGQWFKHWCYLAEDNVFMNTENRSIVSQRGFDNYHRASDPTPSITALASNLIDRAHNRMYLPCAAARFVFNGRDYINTYIKTDMKETARDLETEQVFAEHMSNLVPDERLRSLMINFFGHLITNPGDKIKWALFLQGTQGIGKSYFENLMRLILGPGNVKSVTTKTLNSKFNTWAEDAQFIVLNEIKIPNHNRYEVLDGLKPFLTDEVIEIHPKGFREREAVNVTNCMITTNYRDAIPISQTERRYLVILSDMESKSGLYYERLFNLSNANPSTIRDYIVQYPIHPDFKPKANAPESMYKAEVIDITRSPIDELILEEIDDNHPYITEEYVSASSIRHAHEAEYGQSLQPAALNGALTRMGYLKLGRFMILGERQQLWVKDRRLKPSTVKRRIETSIKELREQD